MNIQRMRESRWWPEIKIVALCIIIFALLQQIRVCYFLTDDNLTGWLPIVVECGRRIFELKNPLINDYLYGGVDLRMDAGILSICNPLTLLLSPFSLSRFYYWLADATALFHLCAGALVFYRMSRSLQSREQLRLSPQTSTFLALSWAFSGYSLCIGSSWLTFLANLVALPLLFWGIFHPNSRRSFVLLFSGAAYSLFFGHLHPFLYSAAILSFVTAAVVVQGGRWSLLGRWIGAHLLVFLLAAPLLLPGYVNVMHSSRSQVVTSVSSSDLSMSALVTTTSMIAGPVALLGRMPLTIFQMDQAWVASLAFSATSLCFAAILIKELLRRKRIFFIIIGMTLIFFLWRPDLSVLILLPFFLVFLWAAWSILRNPAARFYEKVSIAAILILLLFVHRPDFISDAVALLPVYRMLRWPFREILQMVFFMHLFLCFRMGDLSDRSRRLWGFAGVLLLMMVPMLGAGGGSLNAMEMDRKLIISGQAEAWWKRNEIIDGGERWLPVFNEKDAFTIGYDTPFSLLGAYNYPSLFRVKSSVGYWGSWIPIQDSLGQIQPYHWSGILTDQDLDLLLKKRNFQYVKGSLLEGGWIRVEAFGEKGVNTTTIKRN